MRRLAIIVVTAVGLLLGFSRLIYALDKTTSKFEHEINTTKLGTCTPAHNANHPLKGEYKSGNKVIHTENFIPEANHKEKFPVVLIFHGAGGLGDDDGNGFFQDVAKSLVLQKKIAIVVHYMDQSGLKSANREQMGKYFSTWISTVKNSIEYAKTIPSANRNNISLLGHSLGAQLALHAAANKFDVKSVAVMAGCFVLPTNSVKSMPPVLILQGTADKTVTIAREKKLVQTLKSVNCKYEEHLLKNVDHTFSQIEYAKLIELIDEFISKN